MNIQFFSSRQTVLPPGWTRESSISIFGSAKVDATAVPGEDAQLRVVTFFASAEVHVPRGCSVRLSGVDIFGSQKVDVEPSPDGPWIAVTAVPILGSIKIRSS